jgi:hypothetical protein
MHAITDTRVARNIQWDDCVLVLLAHQIVDDERLHMGLHGDGVVAGFEDEGGEERVADGRGVDGEVHGDVAEVEGHDGGVGDVDGADHVGAVGEELGGAGEEFDGGYVEAGELVETWWVSK